MREILSLGAAASAALQRGRRRLRVHSVFPSTVNLAIEGLPCLLALTGPRWADFPHSLTLEDEEGPARLGLAPGDVGETSGDMISIVTARGRVELGLSRARQVPARKLGPAASLGAAFEACAARLAEFQADIGADLRLEAVLSTAELPGGDALAEALVARARLLLEALGGEGGDAESLPSAVHSLIGAGRGLTPSGDDFLSGLLAALGTRGRAWTAPAAILGGAIEAGLGRTNEISASFLRLALAALWPGPLADLAAALAAEDPGAARASLEGLLAFGLSSGADLATGFLAGLALGRPREVVGISGSGRS